jgi:septum formation protein
MNSRNKDYSGDTPLLVLASGSPRRAELLRQAGIKFEVIPADIDESRREMEVPESYVRRMASEKALEGRRLTGSQRPVLGADTAVVFNGEIFGKPKTSTDAFVMLTRLSGCTHEVLSAVALVSVDGVMECELNLSHVHFAGMPPHWIRQYCAGDEPMDKAGAYAIQGSAAVWINRLEGSYSGVMGLPLFETCSLLRAL